jgi:hypothetical protein
LRVAHRGGVRENSSPIENTVKMRQKIVIFFVFSLAVIWLALVASVAASSPSSAPPQPTPTVGHVATAAELLKAQSEWAHSRHANSFDDGQGANTTCASCKSPRNWDPTALAAQDQSLDCNACKREPGAPRPALEGGMTVSQEDWHNIGCEICHIPVGNSYLTSIAFWNQATGKYESVNSTTELCAKCHEGTHGFEVIQEQTASVAHKGWDCTKCHGSHGSPSACTNCHDPSVGTGAAEHARHVGVNCTACHDAGGLSIWQDLDLGSRHYTEYVPVRFAHAETSWTSHDLGKVVDCRRCHHPRGEFSAPLVSNISCVVCHPNGAVLFFCAKVPRDYDPNAPPTIGR